ncbi:MAG: C45 family peptidase [Candidatus Nanopelagicales bacterium]
MTAAAESTAPREVDLRFWAIDGGASVVDRAPALFRAGWDAYRMWYLRDGEEARPTYLEGRTALRTHMPELVEPYDALVEAVGGGDLEARFLSLWCPPPLFAACSLANWSNGAHVLLRSYDFPPMLCDRVALRSRWLDTGVLAMADCVWGALDGVNEHGLAVALAFGGRPVVGRGFGVALIVRYVLQMARDVASAIEILRRVPVQLAYNVSLLDRTGASAIVEISPDRPLRVAATATAGNRQGATEWPEHAAFCGTVEREECLAVSMDDPALTLPGLVDAFLRPPLQRPVADHPWGTVYVAAYDADALTLDLLWPEQSWRLALDHFVEGERVRRTAVAAPPARHLPAPLVATGRPLLIA